MQVVASWRFSAGVGGLNRPVSPDSFRGRGGLKHALWGYRMNGARQSHSIKANQGWRDNAGRGVSFCGTSCTGPPLPVPLLHKSVVERGIDLRDWFNGTINQLICWLGSFPVPAPPLRWRRWSRTKPGLRPEGPGLQNSCGGSLFPILILILLRNIMVPAKKTFAVPKLLTPTRFIYD